jgi:hypothetical protein
MIQKDPLIGKTFGKLTIKEYIKSGYYVYNGKKQAKYHVYKCLCSCGNFIEIKVWIF